jgi:DNA-binding CsgD family transcriptional regulator
MLKDRAMESSDRPSTRDGCEAPLGAVSPAPALIEARAVEGLDVVDGDVGDLHAVWSSILRGSLRFVAEQIGPARLTAFFYARAIAGPALKEQAISGLLRIFCGDQQKLVADEAGLSRSRVSELQGRTLEKLGLPERVPLLVLIAANASGGSVGGSVHASPVTYAGRPALALTAPKPSADAIPGLTPSEREIAQLLIDGMTRPEIVQHRATSPNTIAAQIHAVYKKTSAANRFALVRMALAYAATEPGLRPETDPPGLLGAPRFLLNGEARAATR